MREYKGSLAALLEAQHDLTVGYSLEFWDVSTLAKIFGWHPNWLWMSQILTNGLELPLEPLDEERRCKDVNKAPAVGNHTSQELKKVLIKNLLYWVISTRSGSSLVLRAPINFYSYTCNNIPLKDKSRIWQNYFCLQIKLIFYFIQMIVNIRQFCGIDNFLSSFFWLMGGCQNWSRWSGPRNLDQIWTKSGPNLDTIWTGFKKMAAKIPGKILCPHTRELILASALSEKFKFCLYRDCVRTREVGTKGLS